MSDLAAVRQILSRVFGYDSFRPGQEAIISALTAGSDVLAVMPTGAGKSLCFQLPALINNGLTVVVSPLIALMEDQVGALRLQGVAAETLNSSRSREANVAVWRRVASGETRLLYISPERLMTERMISALQRLPVHLIAVDEAHCISRWGPSFRPEYEQLQRLRELFPGARIAALTATADEVTRNDIVAKLFAGNGKTFVSGFDRPNIRIAVAMRGVWKDQILGFVRGHQGESGIVYCLSRKKTEETAAFLGANGLEALPYHAGMDADARQANQDRFMTEAAIVMVATVAFGMGIDKPDVRYVFHTNLPASTEAYYQEIGRAGRDGAPAEALMLYGLDDIRMRRMFIEQDDGDAAHKRREHKRLDALIAYCEAPVCRRQTLLSYFGEDSAACGNCDVCLNPPDLEDGTAEGQKALQAITRTGQRFGAAHIIDVLRGADTEKIRGFGHDNLAAYGSGGEIAKQEWRSILRQLVAAGFLALDIKGHGGLSLTEKGGHLLADAETFRYRRDSTTGAKAKPKKRAAESLSDLTAPEAQLFLALKELRLDLARARSVPAYVIFSDNALTDMARRHPRTEAEFADVHGVGAEKLRDFAAPFLNAIAEFAETA